ncbi:DinB family protein [Paenibacillus agri]|uniref:DinB family protein n=1 Tax=Paenibacillus agri TaxID=2744309 RepID=A0A850EVE5_9BACL|nr:DinB family protein [Paenibacillus agri]NUU63639.1 DinB family protein [Paenibacillus agri]
MEHYLFYQSAYVRTQLLKSLDGIDEATALRIPQGFRNHILWHLGHVYTLNERFAFKNIGLPMHLPDGFLELFENGTSPLNEPVSLAFPSLEELKLLLREQPQRIQRILEDRLQESIVPPYTTSGGMRLGSVAEFLSLNLYHEGQHLTAIKLYKTLLAALPS